MKEMKLFSVVDRDTENVIAVFPAVNHQVARRVFRQYLDQVPDSAKVAYTCNQLKVIFDYPETYGEVQDLINAFNETYTAYDYADYKESLYDADGNIKEGLA